MRAWRNATILFVSVLVTVSCATSGPKRTVTVDGLAGTSWEGIWGSDSGHGMRTPTRLTVEQADLGAVAGTIVFTGQGRDYPYPAKGLIETRDGASWVHLTVEARSAVFDLKLLGDRLEGRGTSPIHQGPVVLTLH